MPNSFSGIGGWSAIDADWRNSKTGIANSITNLNNSIADEFSTLSSYVSGDTVMYNNSRYVCTATTAGPGNWDASNWEARTVQQDLGGGGGSTVDVLISYDVVNEELHLDFKDHTNEVLIGGRWYKTVQMPDGNIWLAQNLDYAWEGLTVGTSAYSRETQLANYYNNDENTYGWNGKKCGLLYNAAAKRYLETNKNTLIPGWHVASDGEWNALVTSVGENPGTKLKAIDNSIDGNWPTGWNGTDDYGFSVIPGGVRDPETYQYLNSMARFWTSSIVMTNYDRDYYLGTGSSVTRDYDETWDFYSIRLVKDNP